MTDLFPIPKIETARLVLREPLGSDADPLGTFISSERAIWIGGPYPATDAPDWLAHQRDVWARRGWGSWIATLKNGGTPIGRIGLLEHDGWPEPELAWFLFDGFEGRGYAREAAFAARSYCYATLSLPALFSFIEPGNGRSRKLAQSLGAERERVARFQDIDFDIFRHPGPEALQ